MAEKLVLNWDDFGKLAERLADRAKERYKEKIDIVIGLVRGGVPLALVVSDRLGAELDLMRVKSYSGIADRAEPKLVFDIHSDIEGKHVLVVDDLSDKGDTFDFVVKHLKSVYRPGKISTAAVFVKPWSQHVPEIYLEKTEKWIVYPWELKEFGVI